MDDGGAGMGGEGLSVLHSENYGVEGHTDNIGGVGGEQHAPNSDEYRAHLLRRQWRIVCRDVGRV